MAKKIIDIGSSPNKGDGDPLRTAFNKVNENFTELYDANLSDPSNISSDISPATDSTFNLGSEDKQWADVYVSDFIYLNGQRLEASASGAILVNGSAAQEVVDIKGSVFADDSTLLVDSVAGKLRGDIESDVVNIDATTGDINITSIIDDIVITAADNIQLTAIDNVNIYAQDNIIVESNGQTSIRTDVANANHNFIFGVNGSIAFPDGSEQTGAAISVADLKTLVAASTDFADFQTRIAAL